MVNDDQSLRIALNVSQSRTTATGRTAETLQGGGIHHIALACDDIFACAARVQAGGIELLPVPDNYYDDLAARLDLEPGLVERMRQFGVLYDENADGAFFHFYVRSFVGSFFFEIVQRVGRYAGFGAANAAVRMTAQSAQ
jgi:4-hydroxyphenylpyruvate dioxygenase